MRKPCESKELESAPEWEEGIEPGEEGRCGAGVESVASGLAEGRRKEADVYFAVLLLQHPCCSATIARARVLAAVLLSCPAPGSALGWLGLATGLALETTRENRVESKLRGWAHITKMISDQQNGKEDFGKSGKKQPSRKKWCLFEVRALGYTELWKLRCQKQCWKNKTSNGRVWFPPAPLLVPGAASSAGQSQGLPSLCPATAPQGVDRCSLIHDCHAHPVLISMHLFALLNCLLLWPLYFLPHSKTPQCEKPVFACLPSTTTPPLDGVCSSLTPGGGRFKGRRRFTSSAVVQFGLCWSKCLHQGESPGRRNLAA